MEQEHKNMDSMEEPMAQQKRTIDVLRDAQVFHRKLSDYYDGLSQQAERAEAKLLLEYMARHQALLEKAISEYEAEAPRTVLDSWFRPSPDLPSLEEIDVVRFRTDMTRSEIVDMAMAFDRCLLKAYRELAERSESMSDGLADALNNILAMEEQADIKMRRSAFME